MRGTPRGSMSAWTSKTFENWVSSMLQIGIECGAAVKAATNARASKIELASIKAD
jgi:hypothetical protein